MKSCLLFPGQGAQYVGMGSDLIKEEGISKLFDKASEISGKDIQSLLFDGPADELKKTDNTQIAITLINIAALEVLKAKGIQPAACAGFSLGEYAALYCAGVLNLEEVFTIVLERGKLMQETALKLKDSLGQTGMLAVLKLSPEKTQEIIENQNLENSVFIANYNSPQQIVLSGTLDSLERITTALKEAGARRVVPLQVSGPFHSPFMKEAALDFVKILSNYDFQNPKIPLFSNVTGEEITSGEMARELAVKQIFSPVRWIEIQQKIVSENYETILECGPGKVLCGLWAKTVSGTACQPAGTMEQIQNIQ